MDIHSSFKCFRCFKKNQNYHQFIAMHSNKYSNYNNKYNNKYSDYHQSA